jgi:hypothetical protein
LSDSAEGGPRYSVGSVLNVNGQCDRWEGGDNERAARMAQELAQLMADAERAVANGLNIPLGSGEASSIDRYINLFHGLAANAEADVLEYGLKWLNVEPQFIEDVYAQLMREVWFVNQRTDHASRQQMVAAIPGLQPNAPFTVEPGKYYRHPDDPHLTLSTWPAPPKAIVQDNDYYLANLPRDTWVRLRAPGGAPLSIALRVSLSGEGLTLSAMWLSGDLPLEQPPAVPTSSVEEEAAPKQQRAIGRSVRQASASETTPLRDEDDLDRLNLALGTVNELVEGLWWILDLSKVPKQQFAFLVQSIYVEPAVTRLAWIQQFLLFCRLTKRQLQPPILLLKQTDIVQQMRATPLMQPLVDLYDAEH